MRNYLKDTHVKVIHGSISTSAQTHYSSQVDMAGYEGCCFVFTFRSTGASTGTAAVTIVATNTSTADSTSYTAITGAAITVRKSTAASATRTGAIDVCFPQQRYLKAKVVQQEKIATLSIVAHKYSPKVSPVVQSTAVSLTAHAAATVAASFPIVVCQSTST
jgi:hypothetical protein